MDQKPKIPSPSSLQKILCTALLPPELKHSMILLSSLYRWPITTYANFFRYVLCNASFTASVWLMLSLVRDRYRLLCCRFADSVAAKSKHTLKNIHWILFGLSLASVFFSLPRFFEIQVSYNHTSDQYSLETSDLVDNVFYMVGYRIVGSLIFYSAIPYIFTFITSFKIWLVLKNASKVRKAMYVNTSNSSIMSDSDRVIVTLAIRFLVSRFPTTLIDIAESFLGTPTFFSFTFASLAVHTSNFIVVLSSASTFFTFYIFSKKFRKSIWSCKNFDFKHLLLNSQRSQ